MKKKEKRELVEETRKKVIKQYSERICFLEKTIENLKDHINIKNTALAELRKENTELQMELANVKNAFEHIKSITNLTDEERSKLLIYFDEKMKNEKNISAYLSLLSNFFV